MCINEQNPAAPLRYAAAQRSGAAGFFYRLPGTPARCHNLCVTRRPRVFSGRLAG